jgi:hypothetical protein
MSEISYGLYEQIINEIINDHLKKIDHEPVIKDTGKLDAAESSKVLAEYLKRILQEVFNYIEDGSMVIKDRVDFCNSILHYIAECIEKGDFGFKNDLTTIKRIKGFFIQQDAQMLLSLIDRRNPRYSPMIHGVILQIKPAYLLQNKLA